MSSPSVGVHDVTCNQCGASGQIRVVRVKGDAVKVEDAVVHQETCSRFVREQPRHLRDRGSWQRQEKRANALVGARATLASGAVNLDGDGRVLREWRSESKQTKYDYFDLKQQIWAKLVEGALGFGEEPFLHVMMAGQARVVVTEAFFRALSSEDPLPPAETRRRTSFRLTTRTQTPSLVPLDPPGVLLFESEFLKLKEAMCP